MHRSTVIITVILAITVSNQVNCTPASAHLHPHTRNLEREEDGSYKPRDHNHISEDGAHNVEFDHEAILGSAKEAEEYDTLPPEEAKKRLLILVKKMDLNNDQNIDRNELRAWIIRSFKNLSEEDAEERFEDIDENQDSRITWKEYLMDYTGSSEEEPSGEQLIDDDKETFDAADLNKDGYLEHHEFVIFNRPEEHPETLAIILRHTLRDKDTNKDGFIDFQEFVGERGFEQNKEWILGEKERFANEFDKNKDGHLDNGEILAWIAPSNEDIAEEEVDHLFASSDDDHDNLLSFDEVIEHHDIFVGSEATDYGEHLHKIDHDEL